MNKILTIILATGLLTGCAANMPVVDNVTVSSIDALLDHKVCSAALIEKVPKTGTATFDEATCKKAYTDDDLSAYKRLLRAQLILEVSARYGAARIEDYSDGETIADASRLLVSLKDARAKLKSLNPQNGQEINFAMQGRYFVHRTDVAISLLRVVNDATRSVRTQAKEGLLLPAAGLISKAEQVLKNIIEDTLYAHAYGSTLYVMTQESNVDKLNATWADIDAKIQVHCERIAQLASAKDATSAKQMCQ